MHPVSGVSVVAPARASPRSDGAIVTGCRPGSFAIVPVCRPLAGEFAEPVSVAAYVASALRGAVRGALWSEPPVPAGRCAVPHQVRHGDQRSGAVEEEGEAGAGSAAGRA